MRERAKFVLKQSVNLGGICEVDGRSWRTSLHLQRGKGENTPLTAVLLLNPKE